MLLTFDQAQLIYLPRQADGVHMALADWNQLLTTMPFISWSKKRYQRNFIIEKDLVASKITNNALFQPAKPVNYASIPETPWSDGQIRKQAVWEIIMQTIAYTDTPNEVAVGEFENPSITNLKAHITRLGRDLVVSLIRKSTTPATNSVAGIAAQLTGWTNDGTAQGYNPDVFAQQNVVHNGTMFKTGDKTTNIDMALAKLAAGASNAFIIAPARFYVQLKQSYLDRGAAVPSVYFDSNGIRIADEIRGTGSSFLSYAGVPIIPIPDNLYTAAGHTVTGATPDYDLFVVSMSPSDPFGGAHIGYFGDMAGASKPPVQGTIMPLGTGIKLEKTGKPQSATGIKQAEGRLITAQWQFCLGTPQSAVIISGVKD